MQPLADFLRDLDRQSEAFLAEVDERFERHARYGEPLEFDTPGFANAVLDRAYPARVVEAQRGLKALALAPSMYVYGALMRGERVPWQNLDMRQAEAYGLKRRQYDGRYGCDDFNDIPRRTNVS